MATLCVPRTAIWPPKLTTRSLFAERSEEHTSELQSHSDLVCRLLLEKKKRQTIHTCNLAHHESLLFFFYRYGDHRALHSFPTRRSSDLAGAGRERRVAQRERNERLIAMQRMGDGDFVRSANSDLAAEVDDQIAVRGKIGRAHV